MEKRIIIFILLVCYVCTNAFAQDVCGKIQDEQHSPISYATVFLCNSSDSSFIAGCTTDQSGFFCFQDLKELKQYFLKISCLGYKSKTIPASFQCEMKITLEEDNKALGEIVIKGHRSYIKQEGNKTIFNLKNMMNIESLKMNEVLRFAPRVIVTPDGDVKIAGKTATILVNGRRLSGDETSIYLSGLNAADVSRIEIMQNHSGEKDANIQGGIINIITKQKQLGFNGSLYVKVSSPSKGYYAYSPITNLFFGTEKWNIYGMYSYEQGRKKQYSETTNDYLYNNTKHEETSNYFSHIINHYYRLGTIWSISKRQHLEFEWNGVLERPKLDSSAGIVKFYTSEGNAYDGRTFSLYRNHSDFMNLALSYQWNLDKKDGYLKILLNRNYKKSSAKNKLDASYPLHPAKDVSENDFTASNASNWLLNADLQKKIGTSWVLNLGGNMSISTRKSEYNSENLSTNETNYTDWKYKENIGAAYIGVSKDFSGHCFVKINLRGEYTDVLGSYEQVANQNVNKKYMNWFPYLYFSYTPNKKWKYDIQYNRSIYRPPFSLMNAFANRINDVLYDKGNPDLRAALTDKVALTMNYQNHSVSVSYSRTPKDIVEYFQVENGITYHTNANTGSTSTFLLDYSYNGNICSWWQANLYASVQYTYLPQSYNRKHLWGGNLSVNNLLDLSRIGVISIDFGAMTHTAIGNSYIKGNWALDMSYRRYFFHKKISFRIGIDDIFDTQHQRTVNTVPTLRYSFYSERQYRKIWCSLTCNLSSKSKVEKKRMSNSNGIKERL